MRLSDKIIPEGLLEMNDRLLGISAVIALGAGFLIVNKQGYKYPLSAETFMAEKMNIAPPTDVPPLPSIVKTVNANQNKSARWNEKAHNRWAQYTYPQGASALFDIGVLARPRMNSGMTRAFKGHEQSIFIVLIPLMLRKHLENTGDWNKLSNPDCRWGEYDTFLGEMRRARNGRYDRDSYWNTDFDKLYEQVKDIIPLPTNKDIKTMNFTTYHGRAAEKEALLHFLKGKLRLDEPTTGSMWCRMAFNHIASLSEDKQMEILLKVAAQPHSMGLFDLWAKSYSMYHDDYSRYSPLAEIFTKLMWWNSNNARLKAERKATRNVNEGTYIASSTTAIRLALVSAFAAFGNLWATIPDDIEWAILNIRGKWVGYKNDPNLQRYRREERLEWGNPFQRPSPFSHDLIVNTWEQIRPAVEKEIAKDRKAQLSAQGAALNKAQIQERAEVRKWLETPLTEKGEYVFGKLSYGLRLETHEKMVKLPWSKLSYALRGEVSKAKRHPDIATPAKMKSRQNRTRKAIEAQKAKALEKMEKIKVLIEKNAAAAIAELESSFKTK